MGNFQTSRQIQLSTTMQGLYIILGGTNPDNKTWIYGGLKWKQNLGKSVGIAAASAFLTLMSHVLLWALVRARDALWAKVGPTNRRRSCVPERLKIGEKTWVLQGEELGENV